MESLFRISTDRIPLIDDVVSDLFESNREKISDYRVDYKGMLESSSGGEVDQFPMPLSLSPVLRHIFKVLRDSVSTIVCSQDEWVNKALSDGEIVLCLASHPHDDIGISTIPERVLLKLSGPDDRTFHEYDGEQTIQSRQLSIGDFLIFNEENLHELSLSQDVCAGFFDVFEACKNKSEIVSFFKRECSVFLNLPSPQGL